MIGTVLNGNYRVERIVAEGGFGIVYECTELELHRRVALKMLKPDVVGERELRRFITEGRNLASLNHPNVVQIHGLGNTDGRPFIVMELLKGRTLRQILSSESLPIPAVLEIMRHAAAGLNAIHSMGILHRDVTPNNIVITESGVVKILDFGLSKISGHSSTESRGYLVGTLAYVAPEQIEGKQSGMAAEVFAFGIILYEALAGVHPFHAEHHMSLLYNIAQGQHPPLEQFLPDIPPMLATLVADCLEKDPARRVSGMSEIERRLSEILVHSDLHDTPVRAPRRTSLAISTPRNPYLNRVMVKRREDFFGRGLEAKRIFSRLNANPPGSISVVGDRKIGKSSLLNFIYSRSARQMHLERPDDVVMVYVDLQEQKNMSMASFVGSLLGIAALELRGRLDISDCSHDLDGVKKLVQRLDAAGFRFAILLDEFEAVTGNASFNLEFFSFLRFLANHYNVAYVTSSARDLQVLCHNKEISDSPFFNIFSTLRLSAFQRSEAEDLIRIPSERVGKPLAQHTDEILEISGLFPFFIQMACSHVIEYLDEHEEAQRPDFEEVRKRFYGEAKLHYRYIWEGFDSHERSTVLRVARGKGMPDALKHVLEELESRHYIENGRECPRLFATPFAQFVKAEGRPAGERSFLTRWFGHHLAGGQR